MSDIANRLDSWAAFIAIGYECPAAGPVMTEAAAHIRLLEQQLKTAREEERERCARLADDTAIRHGDAVLNLPRGSSAQRLASYASVTLIEFAAAIRSLGEKE